MTTASLDSLSDQAHALKAAIGRLGTPEAVTGPEERADLERQVVDLCAAVQALPPVDARAMTDPLADLIEALESAAQRLHAHSASATDSGRARTVPRHAAAAYGNAVNRRRRGF